MTPGDTLFTIASIEAAQTHPLRATVLLNGDLTACELPGDHAATTLHVGSRASSPSHRFARNRATTTVRGLRGDFAEWPSTLPFAAWASGACWCRSASGTRKNAGPRSYGARHANRHTGSMKSSALQPMLR